MSVDVVRGRASRPVTRPEPVTINRTTDAGVVLGAVSLDPEFFSAAANAALVHQVVTAQLAARRRGTQSTKTRSEVRGGSAKPYRQKGTGSARQGSIRAPHYAGGGVALGPKSRDYTQRTPRKMVQQALRRALSDHAGRGSLRLIDRWTMEVPRTKDALASLAALDCSGRVLVVMAGRNDVVERSFRNIPGVWSVPVEQVTAYDLVAADVVVFTDESLPGTARSAKAAPSRVAAKASTPAQKVSAATAAKKTSAATAAKKTAARAPAGKRSTAQDRGAR
ncbi:MAG TPA: 50S ribosomal protein L4 [Acidimicrobiales bacterium]|nr:50S ribosomal protein L4 [Acidimicrobiales bacterium]